MNRDTAGRFAKAWTVGDYARSRDFVVRLDREPHPGRFTIQYVANYRAGAGITSGGYCSTVGASELAPITEVPDLLLSRAFEAKRLIAAAQAEIKRQTAIAEANEVALRAYEDARDTASALEARRGETGTGSTAEGSDIATGEAGDAHTDVGHLKGNEG